MRPLNYLLLGGLALMLSMPAAFAHKGHEGEYPKMKMLKELNLSEEQREELASIRETIREAMKNLRKELRGVRKELKEAFQNDAPKEALRGLRQELKKLTEELGDLRFEKIISIREKLTPEQRKRFHEMRDHHKHKNSLQHHHKHSDDDEVGKE